MSADFWAGYISGAIGIIIGNPLDLLKVRLQASSASSSPSLHFSSTRSSVPLGAAPTRLPLSVHFNSAATLVAGTAAPILGYGALNALLFVSYNRTEAWLTQALSTSSSSPDKTGACKPGENLTATWMAGALGGLATWVVSTPTELIKCRAQIAASPSTASISSRSGSIPAGGIAGGGLSSWAIAKQVWRAEGVRGLYFGGVVTALRDSIGYGFYFWSYELCGRFMGRLGRSTSTAEASETRSWAGSEAAKVLFCGGIAGIATWASIFPLDVVKTRVQTQACFENLGRISDERIPLIREQEMAQRTKGVRRRDGAWTLARRAYREEGMKVFFRGLGICSLRAFVVNAVQWAVYEWTMRELGQGRGKLEATPLEEEL